MSTRVLAVDLGATSIRVAAVDLDAHSPAPEVIHRWAHGPVRHADGSLRWDWEGIVREVRHGLDLALAIGPAESIGIDGWGVDYGLIDERGGLLSPPYSHRDARIDNWQETVKRLGAIHLYESTGIQLMPINTIFQLATHDRAELEAADRLLLLPDLLVHELTGHIGAERSNASTTALLDAATGDWSAELLAAIDVEQRLLPPVLDAPKRVGDHLGVPVHLVGSHDTASAVAALPGAPGPRSAFVSSGTWVLIGTERSVPDVSPAARDANFSNELGALGGVRFLKNVMGFWMFEQCRSGWGSPPIEELLREAESLDGSVPLIDATDDRFLSPDDMETEILEAAGLPPGTPRAAITRTIITSIAKAAANVVDEIGPFIGGPVEELLVIGGGVRVGLMNRMLAEQTGLSVRVGSPEATALGNALVQGIGLGRWPDLNEARAGLATGR